MVAETQLNAGTGNFSLISYPQNKDFLYCVFNFIRLNHQPRMCGITLLTIIHLHASDVHLIYYFEWFIRLN